MLLAPEVCCGSIAGEEFVYKPRTKGPLAQARRRRCERLKESQVNVDLFDAVTVKASMVQAMNDENNASGLH
jgi:hypothetical protein